MNIVVNQSDWTPRDIELLFSREPVEFVDNKPLPNLLAELGVYKSSTQARKAGRVGELPKGWSEIKASKKVTIWLWNPQG